MSCGNGSMPAGTAPFCAAKIGMFPSGMPAPTNKPLPSEPTMTVAWTGSRAPRPTLVCAAATALAINAAVAMPSDTLRLPNRASAMRPPASRARAVSPRRRPYVQVGTVPTRACMAPLFRGEPGLKVAWAKVERGEVDGVAAYLCEQLRAVWGELAPAVQPEIVNCRSSGGRPTVSRRQGLKRQKSRPTFRPFTPLACGGGAMKSDQNLSSKKKFLPIFSFAALLLSMTAGAGPRLVADAFTATTANMTPAGENLRIQIIEWQEADARTNAVGTLAAGTDASPPLAKLPTVGYIWPKGSPVGYSVKYAHREPQPDGG